MRIQTAINKLNAFYVDAKNNDYIRKPVSWALYHTWKWADAYEQPREIKRVREESEEDEDNSSLQGS